MSHSLLATLPAPLARRVQEPYLYVGLMLDAELPKTTVDAVLHSLHQYSPLPVQAVVFTEERKPSIDLDAQWCGLDDPECGIRLAQMEVVALSSRMATAWQPVFSQLAVPTLVCLPDTATGWDGAGLAVAAASPKELAGLLLLLATDPPTRRRTLLSQQQRLDSGQANGWQVEGVFDSSYSLAIVNRHLALALEDTASAGETVALYTYEQGDDPQPNLATVENPERIQALWQRSFQPLAPHVALRNAWPPVVRDMRAQRRVLANYAWEETGFPADLAQDFNRVLDLITVVSQQTARFLQDAGVTVPIAVVGNGTDHWGHHPAAPLPCTLPPGLRFLHVSSGFPRKGGDVLLAAWGQAFRAHHEVVLVIKTFPNPHNTLAEQLAAYQQRDPGYPAVVLVDEDWTPAQMQGLYSACDILVAPSRGEGFGLPMAEAMRHAMAVIVTGWGGHCDFCTEDTAWLLNYQPQPADTHLSTPGSLWAEPDPEHLRELLRRLYLLTPAERAVKITRARQRVEQYYTWRQVAQRTRAALDVIESRPGPQPPPRIAWISTWESRCGIAAYSAHLTSMLPSGSLQVFAPCNETPEHPDPPWVQRCWRLGDSDIEGLLTAIHSTHPDAVIIQHNWAFFDLATLIHLSHSLQSSGLRVLIEWHNTRSAPAELNAVDYQRVLAACTRLIVHTVADVQHLHQHGLNANVTLLPLAVYPVDLPTTADLAERRQALGLEGRRVIASYGYLMPHKGLSVLVEALPTLLQSQPDVHVLLVNAWYSEASSAAELQQLHTRIAALGLEQRVTLETRYLPESESLALLSLAELVVFPYQHSEESSSAAVRMAISAQRPIATTPLPLFADVAAAVEHLPGTDAAALAAGLNQQLQALADPGQRQAAERKVRDFADQHSATTLAHRLYGMVCGICHAVDLTADLDLEKPQP
jgi:glycosyltransferase involved in cell wall biosynthesis